MCSARPEHKSSDDALVVWAEEEKPEFNKTLFVTSDVELIDRLVKGGVTMIMNSGVFFQIVSSAVDAKKQEEI